jgi:hypothetical protein
VECFGEIETDSLSQLVGVDGPRLNDQPNWRCCSLVARLSEAEGRCGVHAHRKRLTIEIATCAVEERFAAAAFVPRSSAFVSRETVANSLVLKLSPRGAQAG